ncbi:MAG: FeoA domain-containing protein [Bilophila wadsworthia]
MGRNRRPGKEKERAATLDAVRTGETRLYERADDPCLAGRLASLGFLPGVAVRMLRNAKRGPLLVLARHTRVAPGERSRRASLWRGRAEHGRFTESSGGEILDCRGGGPA